MYRKLTLFIAFSAISLLLLVLSFTPLAGGGVNPTTHGPGGFSLALTGADSVKKHGTGGAGTVFPINMPLSATVTSGTSGVEDREGGDSDGGGSGDYTIVSSLFEYLGVGGGRFRHRRKPPLYAA